MFELSDKAIGNAPENVYTAGQGFFRSGCNECMKLPKSFMRPLPLSYENGSADTAVFLFIFYSLPPTLVLIPRTPSWFCLILFAETQYFFPTCEKQCV